MRIKSIADLVFIIYSPVGRVLQTEAVRVNCSVILHKDSPHHAANSVSWDEVPVVVAAAAVVVAAAAAAVDNTDT